MRRLFVTILMLLWWLGTSAVEKSNVIVYINGSKYYIHTVQAGETLYSLSKAYGVDEKVILGSNPSLAEGLKKDANIKIPFVSDVPELKPERKLRKTFDFHFVSKGETLYAISRMYEIPVKTIMEDNPELDPLHMCLGQRLLIRKKKIGSEDEAGSQQQWEAYRQSLNSVAEEGVAYHIVHPGETFYSLSRRFGISESEFSQLNGGLKAEDLKAGAMIKVPSSSAEEVAPDVKSESRDSSLWQRTIEPVEFRALKASEPLHVSLLLPIASGNEPNSNYLEFYQGFLLGLDSVKLKYGRSVSVDLYNTARDTVRIREIVESPSFQKSNLIIGPVYEEGLYPVIRFAEQKSIPVVSPLANVEKMSSDALFQLAPDSSRKYEKAGDLMGTDRQITLIYTESTDKEFEREMLALLGNREYRRHTYKYVHAAAGTTSNPSDLTPLLENDDDNVFIILSNNEVDVDRILAALASADTSLTSRGHKQPRFVVLGNTRWNRYKNIDRAMFFKNRVVFFSSYHAKRDSERVRSFDSSYIRSFGSLPSLFSYRGYDTAMIFAPAMYSDVEYDMEDRRYQPLQTIYLFRQREEGENHVNSNWVRVNYNKDFTITIE